MAIVRYIELAAWDVLLVVLMLLAAGQTIAILAARRRGKRYSGTLLGDDVTRIAAGFCIMCLAVALRIGMWVPWQLMQMMGATDAAWWWTEHAWTWTAAGAILAGVGLSILFWDAVKRHRIAAAALAVVVVAGAVAFAFLT
jgi:hypothetical protein